LLAAANREIVQMVQILQRLCTNPQEADQPLSSLLMPRPQRRQPPGPRIAVPALPRVPGPWIPRPLTAPRFFSEARPSGHITDRSSKPQSGAQ
jgi:hypothetical protein